MLPGNGDAAPLRASANGVDDKTVISRSAWRAVARKQGHIGIAGRFGRARQHAERPEEIRRAASAWIVTAVFSSPRENRKVMKASTFAEARIAFALKHFNGVPAPAGREPRH